VRHLDQVQLLSAEIDTTHDANSATAKSSSCLWLFSNTVDAEAATRLIGTNGYAFTTVDDLRNKAGVSNGTSFHNFSFKEELAVATAHRWSEVTSAFF
jgi:hypothetical protein